MKLLFFGLLLAFSFSAVAQQVTPATNRAPAAVVAAVVPVVSATDLFAAARGGDAAVISQLLKQKVDVNAQDVKGFSPLILAAYNGNLEATKLLLQAGADVNHQDQTGNTALMGVSFKGYAEIATLLPDKNAKPNLQNANGGTALMLAAMFGRHELLKLLLFGTSYSKLGAFLV